MLALAGTAFFAVSAVTASAQEVVPPAPPAPAGAYVAPAPYAAPAYGAPAGAYGAPAPMAGAVSGTTAADRDGDGIIDGYYSADGLYHPYVAPPPPAPMPTYSRRGERG